MGRTLVNVCIVIFVFACTDGDSPDLDELRNAEFSSTSGLIEDLNCGQYLGVFDLGPVASPSDAVGTANDWLVIEGYEPLVDTAVLAGDVWLVADEDGVVYGGVAAEGGLEFCVDVLVPAAGVDPQGLSPKIL